VALSRSVKNPHDDRSVDAAVPSQVWAVARQNLAMLYGFASPDGYNSTEPLRLYLARRIIGFSQLMRLQNLEAMVYRLAVPAPGGWTCGRLVESAGGRVCRAPEGVPLGGVRSPRRWRTVTDAARLEELTGSKNWDPAQGEYLGSFAGGPDPGGVPDGESGPATIETLGYRPEWRHYRINRPSPGPLVLRDNYDPDWILLVDGAPGRVMAANGFQLAGWIPGGTSDVEFRYEPLSLDLGLLVMAATAAALLFWMRRPGSRPNP
jgi:hypothetical protein